MSDIQCFDSNGNALKGFYQWDLNQTVTIVGADASLDATFCIMSGFCGIPREIEVDRTESGIVIEIPNDMLCFPDPLVIYWYEDEDDDSEEDDDSYEDTGLDLALCVIIPVYVRSKPESYDGYFETWAEVIDGWLYIYRAQSAVIEDGYLEVT